MWICEIVKRCLVCRVHHQCKPIKMRPNWFDVIRSDQKRAIECCCLLSYRHFSMLWQLHFCNESLELSATHSATNGLALIRAYAQTKNQHAVVCFITYHLAFICLLWLHNYMVFESISTQVTQRFMPLLCHSFQSYSLRFQYSSLVLWDMLSE